MDTETAEEAGLLRFYGDPQEIANVRAAFARASQTHPATQSHPPNTEPPASLSTAPATF
jgi:hypothetical protein